MRKKLFAILMSAMMMVTFMPAMAFATVTATYFQPTNWAADYSTVDGIMTYSDDTTQAVKGLATTKVFQNGASNSGMVKAIPSATALKNYGNPTVTGDATKYYYDMAFASVYGPSYLYAADYMALGNSFTLNFAQPTGTTLAVATGDAAVANVTPVNWNVKMTLPEYDLTNFAAQSFENNAVTVTAKKTVRGTTLRPDAINTDQVAKKSYYVYARTATAGDVYFFVDEVAKDNQFFKNGDYAYVNYDGAEHTIVNNVVPNTEVTYELYNATTGKFESVDKITFKDAKDYRFKAYAKIAPATTATLIDEYRIHVEEANITVALTSAEAGLVRYEGDQYDAFDFVEFTTRGNNTEKAAADKAIKADAEALKTFVQTYYDVTATPNKYNANVVTLKIAAKKAWSKMTDAEKKACIEAQANWDLKVVEGTQTLTIKAGTLENDIDFLGNASMTKVVHVKAAKAVKTAAVRNVKAEALSGTAITFKKISGNGKIAVAADGKMTIKKGLKKGTYKVVVKATAAAGKGFKRITAKQTYTVKVVK